MTFIPSFFLIDCLLAAPAAPAVAAASLVLVASSNLLLSLPS
jgi:hypothetical protein